MITPDIGGEVTQLLLKWREGDGDALEALVPLVESELRRVAIRYVVNEPAGNSLQASALINEAYVRLINWKCVEWQNRAHFFGVAATIMRRILVNRALRRRRLKRGGRVIHVSLSGVQAAADTQDLEVIALDQALHKLAALDERKSRLVELRFFGGLSEEEAAEAMTVSVRTVQREWSLARSWLFRELKGIKQARAEAGANPRV